MIIEVGLVRGNYSIFSVSDGDTEALRRGGGDKEVSLQFDRCN